MRRRSKSLLSRYVFFGDSSPSRHLQTRQQDKESIVNQHARGVFIKECVRDEIRNFQSLQYDIGLSHQDWMADQVKAAEQQTDNWRTCADQVENMPTTSA